MQTTLGGVRAGRPRVVASRTRNGCKVAAVARSSQTGRSVSAAAAPAGGGAAPAAAERQQAAGPSSSGGGGGGGRGGGAAAGSLELPPLIKVPRSIHEVDNGQILGFGADLAEDHPGFHDEAYKQRRTWIAQLARQHKIGEPLPRIDYSDQEVQVWSTVLRELKGLFPRHACAEFNRTYPLFNFREEEIPQLQDISDVLTATTGWKIRPVAGLMHPRDFLNGLAFKYFHSTQYVRHHSQPMYTPEPDVCHELIGHVPMLADPDFAAMVQAIGVASLGADEKQIWHLTKCYWYTVEFGTVRENNAIKAFGAGILSSYGEMEWMAAGKAQLERFDPYAKQPKMSYKDGFQKRYFVLDSFQEGARLLQDYARTLALPEDLQGNPRRA